MLLCSTDYDSGQGQEYVTMVQQNKVDGIIGLTYNPNLVIEESTSFVSIDRSINPKIPCVTSDNFAGGQLAASKPPLVCFPVTYVYGKSTAEALTVRQ